MGQTSRARQPLAAANRWHFFPCAAAARRAASSCTASPCTFSCSARARGATRCATCASRLAERPRARDRFRQILSFATTIHDRVYLINEQFEKFNISDRRRGHGAARERPGRGALLLGAHMGSFEVMHSLSRRQRGLRVAMAMYEDNARKISAILAAINPNWIAGHHFASDKSMPCSTSPSASIRAPTSACSPIERSAMSRRRL